MAKTLTSNAYTMLKANIQTIVKGEIYDKEKGQVEKGIDSADRILELLKETDVIEVDEG